MPLTINWPAPGQTLQKLFGLKGRIPLTVDETLVPVAVLEQAESTPWGSARSVARHRNQAAGGVGTNAGIMVRPGAGVVLCIDHVLVDNNQANAIRADLRILSPAQVALVTVVASNNMNDMQAPIQTDGSVARTGSLVSSVTHTATIGNVIARINVAADESEDLVIPSRWYLDGDAKGGVGALILWTLTTNELISASFHGAEFVNRA